MVLFPRLSNLRVKPKGRSGGETFLRSMLMVGLLLLVVWLFWTHMENRLINELGIAPVVDRTGLLSKPQVENLETLAGVFRERYNLHLKVLVETGQDPLPDRVPNASHLYIDLNPETSSSRIWLPPLVNAAVGRDFAARLQQEFFQAPFPDTWPENLVKAAYKILEAMMDIDRPPDPQQETPPKAEP